MDEKQINAMRVALRKLQQDELQSTNWYARQLDLSQAVVRRFLDASCPSHHPMTLGKIRRFLLDRGLVGDTE